MNSDDFYGLVPGAIGVLRYKGRTSKPTEEQLSSIQNEMSSSMFSSYLANYQFTKGGTENLDPQTAFIRARQKAREEAEKLVGTPAVMEIYVQVGQKESIDKLMALEKSESFIGWVDDNLVNLIKQTV